MALWSRISKDELWAGNGEIGLEFVRRGRTLLLSGLVNEASGQNLAAGPPALLPTEAPNAKNEVLEVLATQSPLSLKEIVAELEGVKSRDQVKKALAVLLAEGRVGRLRYGVYALPDGASG